jgi:hypothetical protein
MPKPVPNLNIVKLASNFNLINKESLVKKSLQDLNSLSNSQFYIKLKQFEKTCTEYFHASEYLQSLIPEGGSINMDCPEYFHYKKSLQCLEMHELIYQEALLIHKKRKKEHQMKKRIVSDYSKTSDNINVEQKFDYPKCNESCWDDNNTLNIHSSMAKNHNVLDNWELHIEPVDEQCIELNDDEYVNKIQVNELQVEPSINDYVDEPQVNDHVNKLQVDEHDDNPVNEHCDKPVNEPPSIYEMTEKQLVIEFHKLLNLYITLDPINTRLFQLAVLLNKEASVHQNVDNIIQLLLSNKFKHALLEESRINITTYINYISHFLSLSVVSSIMLPVIPIIDISMEQDKYKMSIISLVKDFYATMCQYLKQLNAFNILNDSLLNVALILSINTSALSQVEKIIKGITTGMTIIASLEAHSIMIITYINCIYHQISFMELEPTTEPVVETNIEPVQIIEDIQSNDNDEKSEQIFRVRYLSPEFRKLWNNNENLRYYIATAFQNKLIDHMTPCETTLKIQYDGLISMLYPDEVKEIIPTNQSPDLILKKIKIKDFPPKWKNVYNWIKHINYNENLIQSICDAYSYGLLEYISTLTVWDGTFIKTVNEVFDLRFPQAFKVNLLSDEWQTFWISSNNKTKKAISNAYEQKFLDKLLPSSSNFFVNYNGLYAMLHPDDTEHVIFTRDVPDESIIFKKIKISDLPIKWKHVYNYANDKSQYKKYQDLIMKAFNLNILQHIDISSILRNSFIKEYNKVCQTKYGRTF